MDGEKYVLSSQFKILVVDNSADWEFENEYANSPQYQERIQGLLNKENFLLVHDEKNRFYLINPTIKAFLEAYKTPRNFDEVLQEFASQANCKKELIHPTLSQFFLSMTEANILVSEQEEKKKNLPAKEQSSLAIGSCINDFLVLKKLKAKSDVEIYLAKHVNKLEPVVLKVLRSHCFEDEDDLKAFEQEFKFMKELGSHPNVCQVYSYHIDRDAKLAYGVLEYVNGKNPRKAAKRKSSPLKLSERLDIGGQMLEAIAHVHKKGIVHGDIHASNFLLAEKRPETPSHNGLLPWAKSMEVKLIDFGMSSHLEPQENEVVIYGGVNHYIPPEKLNSSSFRIVNSQSDFRSEVFQLGVTLFMILYGFRPFQAFTWKGLRQAILTSEPIFKKQVPLTEEAIPDLYIYILKKSMRKNPSDRYASVIEMANDWRMAMQYEDADLNLHPSSNRVVSN